MILMMKVKNRLRVRVKMMTNDNKESIEFTDLGTKEDIKADEAHLFSAETGKQVISVLNQHSSIIENIPKVIESLTLELIHIRNMMENSATTLPPTPNINTDENLEKTPIGLTQVESPQQASAPQWDSAEAPQPTQGGVLSLISSLLTPDSIGQANQLFMNLYQMYLNVKGQNTQVPESLFDKRIKNLFYKKVGNELFKMEKRMGISEDTTNLVHESIT